MTGLEASPRGADYQCIVCGSFRGTPATAATEDWYWLTGQVWPVERVGPFHSLICAHWWPHVRPWLQLCALFGPALAGAAFTAVMGERETLAVQGFALTPDTSVRVMRDRGSETLDGPLNTMFSWWELAEVVLS